MFIIFSRRMSIKVSLVLLISYTERPAIITFQLELIKNLISIQVAVRSLFTVPMDQPCQYPVTQESTVHAQNSLNQNLTVKQVTTAHLQQRKLNPRTG